MDVSIIVPLYRGNRYIENILRMIERNFKYCCGKRVISMETILVNDCPDEVIEIDESRYSFKVKKIENEQNKGIHHSRVSGIKASCSKYVMMLDQDDEVADNWMYSQYIFAERSSGDFVVCNGCDGRFAKLWVSEVFEKKVNDIYYYLEYTNAIVSPGQVILRRDAIPQFWMDNILSINGLDDFFLWVIFLKKGGKFSINDQKLFLHTVDRTITSLKVETMLNSFAEVHAILTNRKILNEFESKVLGKQIEARKEQNSYYSEKNRIMYSWLKKTIINREINDSYSYLKGKQIVIYGIGDLGQLLLLDFEKNGIKPFYIIDRNAFDFYREYEVYDIADELPPADIVVLTIMKGRANIISNLNSKLDCTVICIEELIYSDDTCIF